MPFRAKMKRAFGRTSSTEGSDLVPVPSKASSKKSKKQKELPDNIYKPGEMPKPKYRSAYNKEHQDKLSAFSFADGWLGRRKSGQSQYSPMGSRIPSRVGSIASRQNSGDKAGPRSRQHSRMDGIVAENLEGDDDVANVGLSRQHTFDEGRRPLTAASAGGETLEAAKTITNGHVKNEENHQPFTEEELSLALSRSQLRA